MKKITNEDQLEVGQWYWCQNKQWPEDVRCRLVGVGISGPKYLGDHVWVDQAMAQWNIVGPLQRPTDSQFLLTVSGK